MATTVEGLVYSLNGGTATVDFGGGHTVTTDSFFGPSYGQNTAGNDSNPKNPPPAATCSRPGRRPDSLGFYRGSLISSFHAIRRNPRKAKKESLIINA
jgi:hypothetical protein